MSAVSEIEWCGLRKGRQRTSPSSRRKSPATEWILEVSIASSSVKGGRMEGTRFESMVFPDPGGPTMITLCAPADAASSARFANCWPLTSQKSASVSGDSQGVRAAASDGLSASPRFRNSHTSLREFPRKSWIPSTTAASLKLPSGRTIPLYPRRRASIAMGRTPFTGRSAPSSASSPISAQSSRCFSETFSLAASTPAAMGRSYAGPSFLISAGARFTVMRRRGNSKPEFRTAEITRFLASRTEASGSPTMKRLGSPGAMSTSTVTRAPLIP